MPENSPAYLWYPKDVMSSGRVAALSALEELWYRRALDQSWLHEGMPKDPAEFAGWVGRDCTPESAEKIIKKFFTFRTKNTEKVFNKKQELLRKDFKKKSRERSKAGIKSGIKRRQMSKLRNEQLFNKNEAKTNFPFPYSFPIVSSNEETISDDNLLPQIHAGKILAGIAEELGLKKLPGSREWLKHAELAFENGFTAEHFLETFILLRKQEWRTSAVQPKTVTNHLSNLDKLRKEVGGTSANGNGKPDWQVARENCDMCDERGYVERDGEHFVCKHGNK